MRRICEQYPHVKKLAFFCVIGGAGFLVDAIVLHLAMTFFGGYPLLCRIPAFSLAVIVTWYGNAHWTFNVPDKRFRASFPKYLASNLVGLSLNYGLYAVSILTIAYCARYPLAALAIGSAVALIYNYAAAHFWIFKSKQP